MVKMKSTSLIRFILLFSFLTETVYVIVSASSREPANWLLPIFRSILYILLATFILMTRFALADYKIDSLSLALFFFGVVFWVDSSSKNSLSVLLRIIAWIICGIILFKVIRKEIELPTPPKSILIWILIGLVAGIALSLPIAYVLIQELGSNIRLPNPSQYTSLSFIVKSLVDDASNTAIPEEFIFRGLLLGYLLKQLDSDRKAYLVQGLIFWSFHFVGLLTSPIEFWIFLPIGTLLFSFLVFRSHSLAPAIVAHTALNTFTTIFAITLVGYP
jgi:membrane protease YdiL (CAAX protease family)